jgi:hypothetical protein
MKKEWHKMKKFNSRTTGKETSGGCQKFRAFRNRSRIWVMQTKGKTSTTTWNQDMDTG